MNTLRTALVAGTIACNGDSCGDGISWQEYTPTGVNSCQMGADQEVEIVHTAEALDAACKERIGGLEPQETLSATQDAMVVCIDIKKRALVTSCSDLRITATGCFAEATKLMENEGACGITYEIGKELKLRCQSGDYPDTENSYCGEGEYVTTNYRTVMGSAPSDATGVTYTWLEGWYAKETFDTGLTGETADSAADTYENP